MAVLTLTSLLGSFWGPVEILLVPTNRPCVELDPHSLGSVFRGNSRVARSVRYRETSQDQPAALVALDVYSGDAYVRGAELLELFALDSLTNAIAPEIEENKTLLLCW